MLKDALEQNGYTFRSSTDSEVLVNLIEYVRATSGCSLPEAVRQALRQVIGAYAIAVVEKGNHDRIVAARQSSPMVVGVGDGEFFLSSDAASIIEYTEDFVYVGDGEIAVIDRNAPLKIVTLDNHDAKIDIKKLQLSISQLEKGGYPHFMLKEIYEQPRTIVDCIRGRINPDTCEVKLSGVIDHRDRFVNARRIIFVACGTSWHASLIGEHLVESICRIPVEVEYARSSATATPSSARTTSSWPCRSRARRPTRWPPSNWPARPGRSSSASATSSARRSPGPRIRGPISTWGPRSASPRRRLSPGR